MAPYIILALMMSFIWLILFFLRKGKREKMLIMSFAVIPFAFFDYFSQPGYWHPPTFFSIPVGIEGILYGFSFGGIASVLYSVKTSKPGSQVKHSVGIRNIAVLSPVLVISIGLHFVFDINMMISLPLGLLIGCLLMMTIRPDLTKTLLYSGLFFGLIYLFILSVWLMIFPQAQEWWNLKIYGDITVFNVPLGEVLFGFLFGAFWSVLYEFIFGFKLK